MRSSVARLPIIVRQYSTYRTGRRPQPLRPGCQPIRPDVLLYPRFGPGGCPPGSGDSAVLNSGLGAIAKLNNGSREAPVKPRGEDARAPPVIAFSSALLIVLPSGKSVTLILAMVSAPRRGCRTLAVSRAVGRTRAVGQTGSTRYAALRVHACYRAVPHASTSHGRSGCMRRPRTPNGIAYGVPRSLALCLSHFMLSPPSRGEVRQEV